MSNRQPFARNQGLHDQIRKAVGPIMHNTGRAYEAGTDLEFICFLKIARRSASEVQSQLYQGYDRQFITKDIYKRAYDLATEVKRLINSLIYYLLSSNDPPKPR